MSRKVVCTRIEEDHIKWLDDLAKMHNTTRCKVVESIIQQCRRLYGDLSAMR